MFELAKNSSRQGDIGEARAIYEYTLQGFVVARTLFDSAKYDLIVDKKGVLTRVQVKTSNFITDNNTYEVCLKSTGGSSANRTRRTRHASDYDELFIMCGNGDCYIIPTLNIENTHSITVGKKYTEFKI